MHHLYSMFSNSVLPLFKEIHFWVEVMSPFPLLPSAMILNTSYFAVSTLFNSVFVISVQLLPDAAHYTSSTL